jgi:hypothetical protein
MVWGIVDVLAPGTDTGAVSVTCTLSYAGTTDSRTIQFAPPRGAAAQEGNIVLLTESSVTTGQTATLSCVRNGDSDPASAVNAKVAVVRFTNSLDGRDVSVGSGRR